MHGAYYRNSIFGNSYTGLYMGSLKPWGGGLMWHFAVYHIVNSRPNILFYIASV